MLVSCSASFAATPLVVAELDSQRQIAEADAARDLTERELFWRRALDELDGRRHQGVAEIAVMVGLATLGLGRR